MLSLLAPLLVLGVVIFVHELGHFLAAKWAGVYAPRFSLGWGSPLWSFRRGETEYAISWLPIGGYVRMASKEDETASALEGGGETAVGAEGQAPRSKHWDEDSMIPHGPKPIPADRWFESKPLYKRLVIMLAGVFMNVVLALVVATVLIKANGRAHLVPVFDTVAEGKPAAMAGIQPGDSIVAVNGTQVTEWGQVLDAISSSPGKEVTLDVLRAGTPHAITVTPEPQQLPADSTGQVRTVGRIGVAARISPDREPISIGESVVAGWDMTWMMAGEVVKTLKGLIGGTVSINQLGGPLEIVRASVQTARSGFEQVWQLIAFLSINLAILNLLPIPLLDGGQILFQVAQAAWRKEFSPTVREWYARVGLATILLLFVTVTFNDIKRIVTSWFGG